MTIATKAFDAAKYLGSEAEQLELLNDALREGDPGFIAAAIGVIARARGIAEVARETGLSRQALHKSLSAAGNPRLETIVAVLGELGIELSAARREIEHA